MNAANNEGIQSYTPKPQAKTESVCYHLWALAAPQAKTDVCYHLWACRAGALFRRRVLCFSRRREQGWKPDRLQCVSPFGRIPRRGSDEVSRDMSMQARMPHHVEVPRPHEHDRSGNLNYVKRSSASASTGNCFCGLRMIHRSVICWRIADNVIRRP